MMHQLKEHRWIAAVVSVMLVLGLVALCHRPKSYDSGRSLPVGEAFDSLTSMLPKGSTIIARFPDDEKADLYYLNSGVLYCFNGKSQSLASSMVRWSVQASRMTSNTSCLPFAKTNSTNFSD